jgi:hypothetical protein
MIIKKHFPAAASHHALREFALRQPAFATLAANVLTGIFILPIATLPLLDTVSIPLLLLLAVLFGPFAGVMVSCLYPWVEYWVGRKLGSKASFDTLYRIFSWSFFPVGLVSIVSWPAIIFLQNRLGDISLPVALIPLLVVLCFSVLSYCFNVIALHQLSKTKGVVSILITFIFFICIPATIIVCILLIVEAVKQYLARHGSSKAAIGEVFFTSFRKVLIAILLVYAILCSGIFFYDENIAPPVAKALETPLPDIFYPGNSWPALLGFTSPAGGPPFEKEEKRLRAIRAAFLKGNDTSCSGSVADAGQQDELSFQGKLPELYTGQDNGISVYASAHADEVDQLLRDNSELLERYDKLYNYRQYTEPLDYGYCTPFPQFVPVRNIQKVKFLHLARVAQQGNLRGALFEVQKDADFWRGIAINSKTLFSKLISLYMLNTDLLFVAELGAQVPPGNSDEWEIVRAILRPFDQGEMAFKSALEGETLFSLLSFESIARAARRDSMTSSAWLKPNATRNGMYGYYQQCIALSEMTPRNFTASIALKEHTDPLISNWSFIYNPVGEILNGVAKPNIAGYIVRGHRLECLRRLALLKIMAGNEHVQPEDMQRFLETHKVEYGNPYTGEPMKWDAQKKRIYLNQAGEDKEVEIYL